jgi:Carboxymuconolactone decarboxylase family
MTDTGNTRVQQLLGDTAPDLVRLTDDVLFGEVWANPGLSPRDRSLVTVAPTALLGSRDGMVIEAHPGDTIYTAPGEEHWHSAAPGRFMAHLVLIEGDDSDVPQTIWDGKVTHADYEAPRTSTR